MRDTGVLAHQHCIKYILVTNGFSPPESNPVFVKFIDTANIDIKAFSDSSILPNLDDPQLNFLSSKKDAGTLYPFSHYASLAPPRGYSSVLKDIPIAEKSTKKPPGTCTHFLIFASLAPLRGCSSVLYEIL